MHHASPAIHFAALVPTHCCVLVQVPVALEAAHAAVTTLARGAEAMFVQQVLAQVLFSCVGLAANAARGFTALKQANGNDRCQLTSRHGHVPG